MPTTIELPQDAARSVAENINIDSASTTTTAVATGGEDLEAGVSEKAKDAKSAPGGAPPAHDDEFLVTLKGREHLDPHSWSVNYRWFLTALSGSLVLNASKFWLVCRARSRSPPPPVLSLRVLCACEPGTGVHRTLRRIRGSRDSHHQHFRRRVRAGCCLGVARR